MFLRKLYHNFSPKKYVLITLFGFTAIYFFIFSEIPLSLILLHTIISGGDLTSFYGSLVFLKKELLPHLRIMGWDPGSFAGYPIFYLYFPIPFFTAILLNNIFPLAVSFKIATVIGIFALPPSCYFCLKKMDVPFPGPILGSLFSLFFLFNRGDTIWGGNIPSTFSGEFCYSFGISIGILFLGSIYKDIQVYREWWKNGFLLALTLLAHGYPALAFGTTSGFLLFQKKEEFSKRLGYLFLTYLTAFLLSSFWLIPALAYSRYDTASTAMWRENPMQIFPTILIPVLILSIIGALVNLWRKKSYAISYLGFGCLVAIFFFFTAQRFGILDIRFLPFLQLYACLVSAIFVGWLIKSLPRKELLTGSLVFASLLWASYCGQGIRTWTSWVYEGLQRKPSYSELAKIMKTIKGNFQDPRVAFEYTERNSIFGTTRIFELIPLLSGRATLAGIDMLSSLSSPAVYFLQGEFSKDPFAVSPEYGNFYYHPLGCIKQLILFNVKELLVRTRHLKQLLSTSPNFKKQVTIGNYDLYQVVPGNGSYVQPLHYEPILYSGKNWKEVFYRWFRVYSNTGVFLIYIKHPSSKEKKLFPYQLNPKTFLLPKITLSTNCQAQAIIKDEEIRIHTTCIGHPLLLKISYHPDWKIIKGASKIYLISPSFMMLIPTSHTVILRFLPSFPEHIGIILSLVGMLLVFLPLTAAKISAPNLDLFFTKNYFFLKEGLLLLMIFLSTFFGIYTTLTNPMTVYQKGTTLMNQENYAKAILTFKKIVAKTPERWEASSAFFQIGYCRLKENHLKKAEKTFQNFLKWYPGNPLEKEAQADLEKIKTKLRSSFSYHRFLTKKFSRNNTSSPELRKVFRASSGEQTIGSP